jgi:2-iminobutanoate/2-iminopropanoate deaminase
MTNIIRDIGVAKQIGRYSDAVETRGNVRWLHTSGTPGLGADGKMPADFTGQAELAWQHILSKLKAADMGVRDLVKVTQYLVRDADIPAYRAVRTRMLGDAQPASMLMVVAALPQPGWLIEIEAIAAKDA